MSGAWTYVDFEQNSSRLSVQQETLLAEISPNGHFDPPVTRSRLKRSGLLSIMPYCYIHQLVWHGDTAVDAKILFAGSEVVKFMGEASGRTFTEIESRTGLPTTYIVDLIAKCHIENKPLLGEGDLRHFGRERVRALSLVVPMVDTDGEPSFVLICNRYSFVDNQAAMPGNSPV